MSIPEYTQVLVIGGGPAGSYAASVLAREGIDTVVLEGDKFPRFVDLDSTFVAHGFSKKIGVAFVLNNKDPAYTDFVGAGGPNAYSWNVIRSEADDLIFTHAGKSGAQIFDGVKVSAIEFAPHEGPSTADDKTQDPGRPMSATWTRKEDGISGVIKFDYTVDASGRMGIMSTNRAPDVTVSGSHRRAFLTSRLSQDIATRKRKEMGSPGGKIFYLEMLKAVSRILGPMLKDATLVSEIKAASDWSYSASSHASYNACIVGDAGCFIDPFFSPGVHLAVASGLSAAVTICASVKGQCSEHEALEWHSKKVAEGYTRFLLVVLSALKQIREHDQPVLSDWDEAGFERAFAHFRPIIQGLLTSTASSPKMKRVEDLKISGSARDPKELEAYLSPEEMRILNTVRAREMVRSEDTVNIDTFTSDIIDGRAVNMVHGSLGLISAQETAKKVTR
ncbi:hypothetical protein DL768_002888 [Monosporascus sp. mg162]|nr:hypothetical protein DL768_002888 [Monosporascus sp. mg162]